MNQPLLVIVDDEEDLLELYAYNFKRRGFAVKTFERAKPALHFIRKNRPALVMCDWMMPEMDGLELCKAIKSSLALADLPFVMVTCRTERLAKSEALAAGVTEFLTKPIGMENLVQRIKSLLTDSIRIPGKISAPENLGSAGMMN